MTSLQKTFYDLFGYNKELFLSLNSFAHNSGITEILPGISNLFFISLFAVYYLIGVLISYAYIKRLPQNQQEKTFNHLYHLFLTIGCTYAIFGFTYAAIKFGINMPRPYCSLNGYIVYTPIDVHAERCLSSFPSSHTGLAVMLVYFVWPYLRNIVSKILAISLIALVGLARIALAMHYPADILYSIVLCLAIIKLTKIILGMKHIARLANKIRTIIYSAILTVK